MKSLLKYASGMLISIFELLVGVLLLVDPIAFTSGIIMALGAIVLFAGLICFIKYFRSSPEEGAIGQMLLKGLIALCIGSFCLFGTGYLITVFSLLTAVYGIIILVTGLSKVQKTVDLIRLNKDKWIISAASAALTIICAAIILFNPFATTEALWRFIGITLIIEAVVDAAAVLFGGRDKKPEPEEIEEEPEEE